MKQEDIKYIYEIESSLDLDKVIDSLKKELGLKEGTLSYFSLSKDDLINEKFSIDELKTKVIEAAENEEWPSIEFKDISINVDDDNKNGIEVQSKIKLKLNNVDVEEIIEKN